MRVDLTHEEIRRWAYAGVDRRVSAMQHNRKGAHGFNRSDFWQLDVEGLLAEAAVAKAMGVWYAPITGSLDTHEGDVRAGVQVRSTKYLTGSLLIHDSDPDHDKFVLVTGQNGAYNLAGWIYGHEGKLKKYTKTYKGRTAYWVPQKALRPFKREEFL